MTTVSQSVSQSATNSVMSYRKS